MLLFQKRFLDGIVKGTTTLTFRQWSSARVKVGSRYRVHPIGVIVVDEVTRVLRDRITNADARRAGFRDRRELRDYMAAAPNASMEGHVWRIAFHYGGEDDRIDLALESELDSQEEQSIRQTLDRLDARSSAGSWTRETLALIEANPRIAASRLAPQIGLETRPFKANVVQLKKLGLTISFETGYEISPRGRAFLKSER